MQVYNSVPFEPLCFKLRQDGTDLYEVVQSYISIFGMLVGMECFIQFMARRELISNKIEKFDNRPENYTTWRAASGT